MLPPLAAVRPPALPALTFSVTLSSNQVESWNKHDQKLFEAVEKGDVGRVSVLASRKTARPTKLNALGQSAYVSFPVLFPPANPAGFLFLTLPQRPVLRHSCWAVNSHQARTKPSSLPVTSSYQLNVTLRSGHRICFMHQIITLAHRAKHPSHPHLPIPAQPIGQSSPASPLPGIAHLPVDK